VSEVFQKSIKEKEIISTNNGRRRPVLILLYNQDSTVLKYSKIALVDKWLTYSSTVVSLCDMQNIIYKYHVARIVETIVNTSIFS